MDEEIKLHPMDWITLFNRWQKSKTHLPVLCEHGHETYPVFVGTHIELWCNGCECRVKLGNVLKKMLFLNKEELLNDLQNDEHRIQRLG